MGRFAAFQCLPAPLYEGDTLCLEKREKAGNTSSSHCPVFTAHHSPLTLHHSLFTTHSSPLTLHHSLFTTHSSPLTLHHSLFTTHSSPLTLNHSLLTTHSSPLPLNRSSPFSTRQPAYVQSSPFSIRTIIPLFYTYNHPPFLYVQSPPFFKGGQGGFCISRFIAHCSLLTVHRSPPLTAPSPFQPEHALLPRPP